MTSRRQRAPAGRARNAGCDHERSEAAQIAHLGVNAESGLIHTVECTTAKVADNVMLKDCLHGEEQLVFADRGYHQNNHTIEHLAAEEGLVFLVPTKKPKGGELTEQHKKSNRILSATRAVIEHPFRVIKGQFGFTNVRYRGFKKNTGQIVNRDAVCALQSVDNTSSFATRHRRGARVMLKMRGKTYMRRGQHSKFAHLSAFL